MEKIPNWKQFGMTKYVLPNMTKGQKFYSPDKSHQRLGYLRKVRNLNI